MRRTFSALWLRSIVLALAFCGSLALPAGPAAYAATELIYGDALAAGWQNYSWAPNNLAATNPVYSGQNSIAVGYSAGYQGLYLAHPGLFSGAATSLRFYIHGGNAGGQKISLYLVRDSDPAGQHGPTISLAPPAAGRWSEVNLALADLGAAQATITGIVWQDASNGAQPDFYLDQIALVDDLNPDQPTLSAPSLHPFALPADGATQLAIRVRADDPQGLSDLAAVSVDLSGLGAGTLALSDDGLHDDGTAGDGLYGGFATAASATPPGEHNLVARAVDRAGHTGLLSLGALVVLGSPGGSSPLSLPQHLGWGTNEWNEDSASDWQVQSGLPWDYVYQYITYEWYRDGWGGNFVGRFVGQAWAKHEVPVVSVYLMLNLPMDTTPPTCGESAECYARKLQNAAAVQTYLAALGEAARQAKGDQPVIFQLEPDFYGFMQRYTVTNPVGGIVTDNPASLPVALNLPGYANTLAGFGQRMVDLIHEQAPNALVAPHASMWATGSDPNSVSATAVISQAQRTAAFITAMGGDKADLLTVEWSDRDAGSGLQPWWDDTNRTLPRVNRALLWANTLSRAAGKRLLLWQLPVGNTALDNTPNHYRDNRVAYAFSHPRDLADAGIVGALFGPGAGDMTKPSTDGGFLAAQAQIAYAPPPAPSSLEIARSNTGLLQLHWPAVAAPDLWGYQLTLTHSASGQRITRRLSRAPFAVLLLPQTGRWAVELRSYDALDQLSSSAATASLSLDSLSHQVSLPLLLR